MFTLTVHGHDCGKLFSINGDHVLRGEAGGRAGPIEAVRG
jgi:hypothetical protein